MNRISFVLLTSLAFVFAIVGIAAQTYPIPGDQYHQVLNPGGGFRVVLGTISIFSHPEKHRDLTDVPNATVDDCIRKQREELNEAQKQLRIADNKVESLKPEPPFFRIGLNDYAGMREEIGTSPYFTVTVNKFGTMMQIMPQLRADTGKIECLPVSASDLVKELSCRLNITIPSPIRGGPGPRGAAPVR